MTATHYDAHLRTQTARYDHALDKAGFDAAVVYSGRPSMLFLDDNVYPFKVNPLFKAWLPVTDAPDSFVVYSGGKTPRLIYCQPVDYWHAVPSDPDGFWAHGFDVHVIRSVEEARALMPGGRVAFLGDAPDDVRAFNFDEHNPDSMLNPLHYARACKTDYEMDCLAAATEIGVTGHLAARDSFYNGGSELDIHNAYLAATALTEYDLPYTNIIALNDHTAVLHYTHHDRDKPTDSHSFLIDAGGQFHGYASDITRTYARVKNPFANLIEAVDSVQQGLCNAIAPGVDYVALHRRAVLELAEVLVAADVIRCTAQESVESGLATRFFPHGLGHFLGLQVHDVGGFMGDEDGTHVAPPEAYPTLRLTRTVHTGHVMTIEPGLYFIAQLLEPIRDEALGKHVNWPLVDQLYPYGGIRIEDNVVVTEDGVRNLTRDAFARAA
ncbi:MAG: Xaa-Pro dipeptidase [Gammaproteobacteria bacterium]